MILQKNVDERVHFKLTVIGFHKTCKRKYFHPLRRRGSKLFHKGHSRKGWVVVRQFGMHPDEQR